MEDQVLLNEIQELESELCALRVVAESDCTIYHDRDRSFSTNWNPRNTAVRVYLKCSSICIQRRKDVKGSQSRSTRLELVEQL